MKMLEWKKISNELTIEIEGLGHTFYNLLQKRLLDEEDVDFAGYNIPHPLSSNAIIYIRTKGAAKPEEVLQKAIEKTHKMTNDFIENLKEAIKHK